MPMAVNVQIAVSVVITELVKRRARWLVARTAFAVNFICSMLEEDSITSTIKGSRQARSVRHVLSGTRGAESLARNAPDQKTRRAVYHKGHNQQDESKFDERAAVQAAVRFSKFIGEHRRD